MSCARFREWIIDDLVAGLTAEERRDLEQHLRECDECPALAREQGRTWSDLAAALRAPTDGLAALRAKVAAEFGEEPASGRRPEAEGPSWRRPLLRAAAVVALVGAGVVGGMQVDRVFGPGEKPEAGEEADGRQRFVLLIYEVPDDERRAQASRDVGKWARERYREGVVEDGSELTDEAAWAGPQPGEAAEGRRLTHYLTIRAADLEQARRIAATVPVTAYGGVVEVRPLGW